MEASSSIARVEVFPGVDDQWYYRTVAGNNETLSTSEGYTRKADAVREALKAYPNKKFKLIRKDA